MSDPSKQEYHSSYHFDSGRPDGNGGGEYNNGSYHYHYESSDGSYRHDYSESHYGGSSGNQYSNSQYYTQPAPKKKKPIPVWVIVLSFCFAWPIGVILLIVNSTMGSNAAAKGQAYVRRAADEVRTMADEVKRGVQNGRPLDYDEQDPWENNTKTTTGKTSTTSGGSNRKGSSVAAKRMKKLKERKWMSILGAVIAIVFGVTTFSVVAEGIGYLSYEPMWVIEDAIWPFIFTGVGAGLFTCGQLNRRKMRRYKQYINLIASKKRVSILALAEALPEKPDKVVDTLEDMINDGIFGDQAYIDHGRGLLVLDGIGVAEPPKEKPKEKKQEEKPADENRALLQQIRAVNDRIAHPEMTRKIARVEEITGRILEFQKEHPDRASELRKFLNYYLPTTLKILNSYAELEKQGITGENIDATKERIENMMDMVVEGFERQLDKLFAGDMMDIAADITVMEQMMEGDGLFDKGDDMQMGGH